MADSIQIVGDIIFKDSASATIRAVESSLGSLEQRSSGVGSALAGVGTIAAGAAAAGVVAFGAGLTSAVTSAAGFEEKMSGVKAVSGATAEQMSQLSGLALQLGKDTSFSASEAAAGIEELVKGGLSIPDIMNGAAAATLNLAAAGGTSLPDAATIAANALAQFNLNGGDMAHVADLIAGAANASAIDVNDFKFSLAAAGAVASTVGFSFDDLAQGIAVMGEAGIKGSDAGTSLKTMMLNLQPSTKKAKDEMRDLGIITADGANQFFDAQGKVKSMAQVAEVLQRATEGLTKAQKIQALETMFGSDAIRAAAVLAESGAEGFDEMAASMGKVTAASVGAERLNNLNGSLEQLKGSLETAAITIGMALTPALKGLVDAATGAVNAAMPVLEQMATAISNLVTTGDVGAFADAIQQAFGFDIRPALDAFATMQATFQALLPLLEQAAPVLAAIGAAFVALQVASAIAGGIAAVGAAFAGMSAAVGAAGGVLGVVVAILGGPLTVAIAAVLLAVAGLALAWSQNWGDIQGKTQAAISAIQGVVDSALSFLQGIWDKHGDAVQASVARLWSAAQGAFNAGAAAIQGVVSAGLDAIRAFWDAHGAQVTAIVQTAWDLISAIIGLGVETISALITAGLQLISGDWEGAWATIQGLLQTAWDTITNVIIPTALSLVQQEIALAWQLIAEAVPVAWQLIIDALGLAWTTITTNLTAWLNAADTGFVSLLNLAWVAIQTAIPAAWQLITDALGAAWAGITGALMAWLGLGGGQGDNKQQAAGGLIGFVAQAWATIQGAVPGAWAAIQGALATAWALITTALQTWLTGFQTAVQTAWTAILTLTQTTWSTIQTTLGGIWNGLLTKANEVFVGIQNAVTNAWNGIAGVTSVVQGAMDTVAGAFHTVERAARDLISAVDDAINKLKDLAGMGGGGLGFSIGSFAGGVGAAIGQAASAAAGMVTGAATGSWGAIVPGGSGTSSSSGTHSGGGYAVDIFAPYGTPVLAPVSGVVTAQYYSLGGNTAVLKGSDGNYYYMAHLAGPAVSGPVAAGQQIGAVDNTGNAAGTPSHLHLAVSSSGDFSLGVNGGNGNVNPDVVRRALGGWIDEPVLGFGMATGRRWMFGEKEAEYVVPRSGLVPGGADTQREERRQVVYQNHYHFNGFGTDELFSLWKRWMRERDILDGYATGGLG